MSTVDIDGVTVAYDDVGAGAAIMFVHGHPFNRSMWRPQVEHLRRSGWRVVVPDLRGYGDTTVAPGKTTLETFARDLAALLDHLELERVVLVGISMGGQIAMEFHRLFPDRLRGLVLADTSPHAETADGKNLRIETAERLLREGMGPYADEVLPKMIAPPNIAALPEVANHVLAMMRATSPAGAAAALRGRAERPDYVEMLSRVAVPTLVVVGRDDEFTTLSDAELIHERVPHSRLVVIEGAGHLPNLERAETFNAALDASLSWVAKTTGAQ